MIIGKRNSVSGEAKGLSLKWRQTFQSSQGGGLGQQKDLKHTLDCDFSRTHEVTHRGVATRLYSPPYLDGGDSNAVSHLPSSFSVGGEGLSASGV